MADQRGEISFGQCQGSLMQPADDLDAISQGGGSKFE